jgi:protein gp37
VGDTKISWCHRPGTKPRTWNPTQGCALKSEGCRNCYAMRQARRFAGPGKPFDGLINLKTGKWTGEARLATHKLAEPLSWRSPSTVFVDSMSDLFYERFTNDEIADVFGVMAMTPQHTYQILTKRPDRMRAWFEWVATSEPKFPGLPSYPDHVRERSVVCRAAWEHLHPSDAVLEHQRGPWPLPNVWLGTSVENQEAADERIPELLKTPAAIRFLSCEPLLGPLDLMAYLERGSHRVCPRCLFATNGTDDACPNDGATLVPDIAIDWVIAGCESGPGARECHVAWLRFLREQCAAARVPYFLKQAVEATELGNGMTDGAAIVTLGERSDVKGRGHGGAVIELPYLDGVQHAAFPEVTR